MIQVAVVSQPAKDLSITQILSCSVVRASDWCVEDWGSNSLLDLKNCC